MARPFLSAGFAFLVGGFAIAIVALVFVLETADYHEDVRHDETGEPWETHPLAKIGWIRDSPARAVVCRGSREAYVSPDMVPAHVNRGACAGRCPCDPRAPVEALAFHCPTFTSLMCGPDLEFCATEPHRLRNLHFRNATDGPCSSYEVDGVCPEERLFCRGDEPGARPRTVCGDPRVHRAPMRPLDCDGACPACSQDGRCTIAPDAFGRCNATSAMLSRSGRAWQLRSADLQPAGELGACPVPPSAKRVYVHLPPARSGGGLMRALGEGLSHARTRDTGSLTTTGVVLLAVSLFVIFIGFVFIFYGVAYAPRRFRRSYRAGSDCIAYPTRS